MKCPSRRSGVVMQTSGFFAGPQGCYTVPVFKRVPEDNPIHWWHSYTFILAPNDFRFPYANQSVWRGPFRLPTLTFRGGVNGSEPFHWDRIESWTPSHNFGYWSDGTSNQIMLGEKFIPSWALNSGGAANAPSWDPHGSWDAGFQSVWPDQGAYSATRIVSAFPGNPPIARGPNDPTVPPNTSAQSWETEFGTRYPFGSSHPGIANFTLGDGSVRSVSVSVAQRIIVSMVDVRSGESVSLP